MNLFPCLGSGDGIAARQRIGKADAAGLGGIDHGTDAVPLHRRDRQLHLRLGARHRCNTARRARHRKSVGGAPAVALKALRPGIRQPQDYSERVGLSGLEDSFLLAALQLIGRKVNQCFIVHAARLRYSQLCGNPGPYAVSIILPGGDGIPRHRRHEVQHHLIDDRIVRPRPCAVEGHIPIEGRPAVCLLGAGLIRVPDPAKVILLIQNCGPYKERTAAQHLPAFGSPPLGLSFRRGRADGGIPYHLIADLKVPVGPGKGHIAAHRLAHGIRVPCARAKAAVRRAGRDLRRCQLRAFRHRQLLLIRPILPAAVYHLESHGTGRRGRTLNGDGVFRFFKHSIYIACRQMHHIFTHLQRNPTLGFDNLSRINRIVRKLQ